jgi:hypothetical protein
MGGLPYDRETTAWIYSADTPKELESRKNRAKYLRHKEKIKAQARERYAEDPEKILQRNAQWRKDNPEKSSECKLAWEKQDKLKDPEKYRKKMSDYHIANREHRLAQAKEWRDENPGLNAAKQAAYKARKLQRTMPWADQNAISFFYECCPAGCEVDHIMPLMGRDVSGLHVPENLQWLPKDENRRKHARGWKKYVNPAHLW